MSPDKFQDDPAVDEVTHGIAANVDNIAICARYRAAGQFYGVRPAIDS